MGNPTVTAKVVAKKGCKIRSERSLKSPCVALLAPGTLLSIEGCLDDARVATISPVAGFASLKTLRIVDDASPEDLIRSAWRHFHPLRSDDELAKTLDAEAVRCLRAHGTEPAGTGEYNALEPPGGRGRFDCRACRFPLYHASRKFADQGWIAFDRCFFTGDVAHVGLAAGNMDSIEVHCSNCRSHLGHVFTDGVSGERH